MSSRKVSSKQLANERAQRAAGGPGGGNRVPSTRSKSKRRGGRFLFLLPILLAPALLRVLGSFNPIDIVLTFAGTITLYLGAISVRQGASNATRGENSVRGLIASFPFKTAGAALYGAGLTLFAAGTVIQTGALASGLAASIVFGVLAAGAVVMRYGLDPKLDKSKSVELANTHGLNLRNLVRDLDEAEERVANIRAAITKYPGAETQRKLTNIADLAQEVIKIIEADPLDIRDARLFMITYLPRAEEIIVEFGSSPEKLQKPELLTRFRDVVGELTEVFEDQTKKLNRDVDRDLEVKLKVLSKRLRNEGAG